MTRANTGALVCKSTIPVKRASFGIGECSKSVNTNCRLFGGITKEYNGLSDNGCSNSFLDKSRPAAK